MGAIRLLCPRIMVAVGHELTSRREDYAQMHNASACALRDRSGLIWRLGAAQELQLGKG